MLSHWVGPRCVVKKAHPLIHSLKFEKEDEPGLFCLTRVHEFIQHKSLVPTVHVAVYPRNRSIRLSSAFQLVV